MLMVLLRALTILFMLGAIGSAITLARDIIADVRIIDLAPPLGLFVASLTAAAGFAWAAEILRLLRRIAGPPAPRPALRAAPADDAEMQTW